MNEWNQQYVNSKNNFITVNIYYKTLNIHKRQAYIQFSKCTCEPVNDQWIRKSIRQSVNNNILLIIMKIIIIILIIIIIILIIIIQEIYAALSVTQTKCFTT